MTFQMKDIHKFRSSLRQLERIVSSHNKKCCLNVSMAQCHVLLQINVEDVSTTKSLAKELNLDASTISRTVDGLVKADLVFRMENKKDRRSIILNLTSKGEKLCNDINKDADALYVRVIENIKEKERKSILKGFEILVDNLVEVDEKSKRKSPCCN